MKHILAYFATLLLLCNLSAQRPVIIETVNDSAYVVQLIPVSAAYKSTSAQLVQVDQQLESTDAKIAALNQQRDALIKQKVGLEYALAQLNKAIALKTSNTSKHTYAAPPKTETVPPPEDKPKKKPAKKKKN